VGDLLARRAEFPHLVGQDPGQKLDAEGPGFVTLMSGFAVVASDGED